MISSLIYGRRFEYEDPRFLKLLDLMEEGLKQESGLLRQVGESFSATLPWASWEGDYTEGVGEGHSEEASARAQAWR